MKRFLLFLFAVILVVLSMLNIIYLNYIDLRDTTLGVLNTESSEYYSRLLNMEKRSCINCSEVYFESLSGRDYLIVNASTDESGIITLSVKNVYRDALSVANIREIGIVHDSENMYRVDKDSYPVFLNSTMDGPCEGNIDPQDALICKTDFYKRDVLVSISAKNTANIIRYLSIEMGIEPYYFVEPDLCVKIITEN